MAVEPIKKKPLTAKEMRGNQNSHLANRLGDGLAVPSRVKQTKYKRENAAQAKKLYALGATDADVADFFNVSVQTLSTWADTSKEFETVLDKGRTVAHQRVERSLYQRACGYTYTNQKIFFDARTSTVIRVPIEVHVPPNTTAIIHWLKNRDPESWGDRKKNDVNPEFVTFTAAMTPAEALKAYAAVLRGARVVGSEAIDEETAGRLVPWRKATEPTPTNPTSAPNGQVR
jgi:hypothetical protein